MHRNSHSHLFYKLFVPLPYKISVKNFADDNEKDLLRRYKIELQYEKIYTNIKSSKQCNKYKADYMSVYDEYLQLTKQVRQVEKEFNEFLTTVENNKGNVEAIQKVEEEVQLWYARKKAEKFEITKQKFDYLFGMLKHIRCLVVDFENEKHSEKKSTVCDSNDTQSDDVKVV